MKPNINPDRSEAYMIWVQHNTLKIPFANGHNLDQYCTNTKTKTHKKMGYFEPVCYFFTLLLFTQYKYSMDAYAFLNVTCTLFYTKFSGKTWACQQGKAINRVVLNKMNPVLGWCYIDPNWVSFKPNDFSCALLIILCSSATYHECLLNEVSRVSLSARWSP